MKEVKDNRKYLMRKIKEISDYDDAELSKFPMDGLFDLLSALKTRVGVKQ